MNLAGRDKKNAIGLSIQKCNKIKAKDAWLMLFGKETFRLLYEKPLDIEHAVLNLKWIEGKGLEITEYEKGKAGKSEIFGEKKVSQKLPDTSAEKTGKPSK